MTTNSMATPVTHPYAAGSDARRTYMLYVAAVLGGALSAAGMYAAFFMLRPVATMVLLAVCVALLAVARVLFRRAWWSVAWSHQDPAAEPHWIAAIRRGGQLAVLAAPFVYALSLDEVAVFLAFGCSNLVAGALLVAVFPPQRARRNRRRQAWDIVDATVMTAIAVASVVVIADRWAENVAGWALIAGICMAVGACAYTYGRVARP